MATWITLQPPISCYLRLMPSSSPSPASSTSRRSHRRLFKPFRCVPLQQQVPQLEQSQQGEDEAVILCEDCNGKGWLLCDFCNGQKTNVKSENNRIYRRCPTCKAVDLCCVESVKCSSVSLFLTQKTAMNLCSKLLASRNNTLL